MAKSVARLVLVRVEFRSRIIESVQLGITPVGRIPVLGRSVVSYIPPVYELVGFASGWYGGFGGGPGWGFRNDLGLEISMRIITGTSW